MRVKIGVIGDKGSVQGFKAVGFETFQVDSDGDITNLVNDLAKREYGILFVMEDVIIDNFDVVEKYKNSMLPAIIPIPGRTGNMGIGITNVHKNVERAVGADIFNN